MVILRFLFCCFLLVSGTVFAQNNTSLLDSILALHVDKSGNVDYMALKKDQAGLKAYLDYLALHPPSQDSRRVDSLAYYINLYNAATLQLIIEYYPLKSIKDIDDPWGRAFVHSGDEVFSLEYIEHDILRKMDEPRIHFAINCASRSCPPLYRNSFKADSLESQLQAVTKAFINNPAYNQLKGPQLNISRLFNWYKKDFGGRNGVIKFLEAYSDHPIKPNATINYLKYDWQLNEQQ